MKAEKERTPVRFTTAMAVVAAGCVCFCPAVQSEDGSVEVRELRAALKVAQNRAAEAEAKAARAEAQRKEIVKSLAEAVRVSEEQVAASREIQLKLQAFGVDLFTMDQNSLQQRLLNAVRDLDIANQEKEAQTKALRKLSDSFVKYLEQTREAPEKARQEATSALRESGKIISLAKGAGENNSQQGKSGLDNSKVVSIDSEIGLLVLDAGRANGVKVGTPIAVLRGERPIFTAMVVDVRESICGALLQDKIAENDAVKVGDVIRLLPENSGPSQ